MLDANTLSRVQVDIFEVHGGAQVRDVVEERVKGGGVGVVPVVFG